MKITNKTLAYLIIIAIAGVCHYIVWQGDEVWLPLRPDDDTHPAMVASWVGAIVFYIAALFLLFSDEIHFSVTIPVPLEKYRATLKAKRELAEATTAKYVAMAKAEGSEFDRLHEEVKVLGKHAEKLEL